MDGILLFGVGTLIFLISTAGTLAALFLDGRFPAEGAERSHRSEREGRSQPVAPAYDLTEYRRVSHLRTQSGLEAV